MTKQIHIYQLNKLPPWNLLPFPLSPSSWSVPLWYGDSSLLNLPTFSGTLQDDYHFSLPYSISPSHRVLPLASKLFQTGLISPFSSPTAPLTSSLKPNRLSVRSACTPLPPLLPTQPLCLASKPICPWPLNPASHPRTRCASVLALLAL